MTAVQSFLRNPFRSMPKVLFLLVLLASIAYLPVVLTRAEDPSPGSTGFVAPAMDAMQGPLFHPAMTNAFQTGDVFFNGQLSANFYEPAGTRCVVMGPSSGVIGYTISGTVAEAFVEHLPNDYGFTAKVEAWRLAPNTTDWQLVTTFTPVNVVFDAARNFSCTWNYQVPSIGQWKFVAIVTEEYLQDNPPSLCGSWSKTEPLITVIPMPPNKYPDLQADINGDGGFSPDDEAQELTKGAGVVKGGDLLPINLRIPAGFGIRNPYSTFELSATGNVSKVKFWADAAKQTQLTLPASWNVYRSGTPASTMPTTIYVEGIETSIDLMDIQLFFRHTLGGTQDTYDKLNLTVVEIAKLPLGHDKEGMKSTIVGKVYIPTKYGGKLEITGLPVNLQAAIYYTNGSDLTGATALSIMNGDIQPIATGSYAIPSSIAGDKYKWFYVKFSNADAETVKAKFTQSSQAVKYDNGVKTTNALRPWNFYYWPAIGDYIYEPGGKYKINGTEYTSDFIVNTSPISGDVAIKPINTTIEKRTPVVRSGNDGILHTVPSGDDQPGEVFSLFGTKKRAPNNNIDAEYRPLFLYSQICANLNPPYLRSDNTPIQADQWEREHHRRDYEADGHCKGGTLASILLNQPNPFPGSGMSQDELEGVWQEAHEHAPPQTLTSSGVEEIPSKVEDASPKSGEVHGSLERNLFVKQHAAYANLRAASVNNSADEIWNHAVFMYDAEYVEAGADGIIPGGEENIVEVCLKLTANADIPPPSNDNSARKVKYKYVVAYDSMGGIIIQDQRNKWYSASEMSENGEHACHVLKTISYPDKMIWKKPYPEAPDWMQYTGNPDINLDVLKVIDVGN